MIGIDIISIKRIIKISKKHKNFPKKILHKDELLILKRKTKKEFYYFLSGRWAIKEAIFKCGINKPFNVLNISYNKNNQPILLIDNKIININISISHEIHFAIAIANLI